MIIIGTSALRPKNLARLRWPRRGAVNAEQDGGAGDSAAVEQVADRDERGRAVHALLAADVDRQLGRLIKLFGQLERADLSGQQPRALERHQPAPLDLQDDVEHRLDAIASVDRDRDDRQIF